MLGSVDWNRIQERYIQFWGRTNEKPLVWVTAPEEGINIDEIIPHQPTQNTLNWITGPYYYSDLSQRLAESLDQRWLDTGKIVERARLNFQSTYYGGAAYPVLFPDLGADIMGAILGCDLELGDHTTWCKPVIEDWKAAPTFQFDPDNKWWKRVEAMLREMSQDARGDYFVSITDIHPGVDSLVAMRGPDRLALDLYDNAAAVKEAILNIWIPFEEVYDRSHHITAENLPGSSNWMGAWHPGKWHTISADFTVMLSHSMFDEFVLPEIKAEAKWLDASIFHLDGPQALRHLDALLEVADITGIAWLPGAGKPPISEWIPVLQKIQKAGKVIQAEVYDWEIPKLVAELDPQGVLYVTSCKTKEDAQDLLALVDKSSS
jgi:hypothetical protein